MSRRGQGGGCRARLDEAGRQQLRELLVAEPHWTTHQIQQLIKEKFAVEYSARQVCRVLRGLGLYFYKPFQLDEKRPDDAPQIMSTALFEAFKELHEKGVDLKRVAIGFGDESSPQTAPNTARFWSVAK